MGAKSTVFSFSLESNETKTIDFSEYGVPSSAVILSVHYTPNGSACFPVELHGNDARRRRVGTKVIVFGRPLNTSVGEVKVSALVVWTDQWGEPDAWLMLADALEEAAVSRFTRAIVPAHSAFEISLSRFLKGQLEVFAARDAVKGFMVNNLTASAALNVVLPYVCGVLKLSRLPAPLRGCLNRLRNLRNSIVHDGLKEVDSSEARELLCAAVFGFEYLRFLREKIIGKPQPNNSIKATGL